jgi:hypothetical protein|tara:strand:+ start:105 stop:440 length:336 start_codon:yes stop_codon:yes gene_type:complete
MSSEREEFEKDKRDRARKLELETLEKQRRTDKMRERKYRDRMRDRMRDRFGRMTKPTPQSRRPYAGAEIGVEDDGYKAAEIQSLIDRYEKKDDTYSGKVIKSIKPSGKQPV